VELRHSLLVKCLVSIAAALVAFFVGINPAWSALGAAALLLLLAGWEPRAAIKRVDLQLLLYVAGLFIIVGALRQHGASQAIFDVLQPWIGDTPMRQGWTLTLLTAVGSNVVGDIPFVLVASDWMSEWVQPRTAWMVMAMASTFAGNLMLTSSMATLLVRDAGRDVARLGFVEHLRYGAVITLVTLVLGTFWLLAVT
jgi:Na+/H+ antiporter NhaD/arsenite permease-like protein